MPLNLTKKYNDLLDILGMSESQRNDSLRRIFNRDIQDNPAFSFRGCFITTVKIVHKKNASAKGEDISKLFIC